MHHLEINMREHVESFCTAIRLDHQDLLNIGITRPILHECVVTIVEETVNSRMRWIPGYASMVVEPADILADAIRKVTANTENAVGDGDISEQVENHYLTIIGTMSQSIDQIKELVDLLIPKPTWLIAEVKVIGERAFISLGEDFRIQDYERLKEIEAASKTLSLDASQDDINVALGRLKQAYRVPVGRFKL